MYKKPKHTIEENLPFSFHADCSCSKSHFVWGALCYVEAYLRTLRPSQPILDPFELENNTNSTKQSKHEEHQQPKESGRGPESEMVRNNP